MKVSLVLLPQWDTQSPPLGINYIGKALREANHNVSLLDYNNEMRLRANELNDTAASNLWDDTHLAYWFTQESYNSKVFPVLKNLFEEFEEKLVAYIHEHSIEILGFSTFYTNRFVTLDFIKRIKAKYPKLLIVLGGPSATLTQEILKFLYAGLIDAIIPNEGEQSIVELVDAWEAGSSIHSIPGVRGRGTEKFEQRPPMDMNELPIIDYVDFNFEDYQEVQIPIMMSRGCVAKCTFCDEPGYWGKFRFRKPEGILKEMKFNSERYGIKDFEFMDSLINGHIRYLSDLAILLRDEKLDLVFGGNARVSKNMDYDFLKILKEAGCSHLVFGMESGSQAMLDLMKKNIKTEWACENFKNCYDLGIEVHINLIVGFPGETEKDFQETIKFVKSVRKYLKRTFVMNMELLPGTDVFMNPQKYDIKLNGDGSIFFDSYVDSWINKDGLNNLEVRLKRRAILQEVIAENPNIINYPLYLKKG